MIYNSCNTDHFNDKTKSIDIYNRSKKLFDRGDLSYEHYKDIMNDYNVDAVEFLSLKQLHAAKQFNPDSILTELYDINRTNLI
jgi:hypothetical protein